MLTPSHDARQPHGWAEDSLINVVEKVNDLASPDALGYFSQDGNGDGRAALGSLGQQVCFDDGFFGEMQCFDVE